MDRDTNLKRVTERTEPWDVVVIGGGATGAGCALDAASRGLDVLLLEQHDFGKGTSSRSTKLIHGGVRYLRQGNISLVREALRERGLLLKNAPHVVHKQEFVIPYYSLLDKIFYGVGMKIYDLLAGKYGIGKSKVLTRSETLAKMANLDPAAVKGGVLYYDAQFDDMRLLIDILRTADSHGACVLNYARVKSFGKTESKIDSVTFVDEETSREFSVKARSVINATGAFGESLRTLSDEKAKPVLAYSQGIHLVFDRKFFPSDSAVIIPKTKDGRVLFCIPWNDHVLVGTTDTPVASPSFEPHALEAEIEFVLETIGSALAKPPERNDVLSVWAGIRPLVKTGDATRTFSLSRSHDLFVDASGLVTITGGKWTTYRRMAEDAVNKAVELGGLNSKGCMTAELKVEAADNMEGDLLHDALTYTVAHVRRAVRDEMGRNVEDVLARRTRVLFLNAKVAIEISPAVASIMAEELGKGDDWMIEQIEDFARVATGYILNK